MDSTPHGGVLARLRAYFRDAGFDQQSYERIAVELKQRDAYPAFGDWMPEGTTPAEFLFYLFVGGRAPLERCSAVPLQDLQSAGLIEVAAGIVSATVRVRPMFGLYVLSDLERPEIAADFVFAPDDPDSLGLLAFLPMDACGSFLEACGGSGAAALASAAHCAQHAWSTDISERCTTFARRSAALSGLDNFTALTGDTYQPVAGHSFDRIALNPPFIPGLSQHLIGRDGGQDGEQITRKHIEELHGLLNPEGRLYGRCMVSDRTGEPFEQRMRRWLGPHSSEYDVAIHVCGCIAPSSFLLTSLSSGRAKPQEIPRWEDQFRQLQIERFLMAAFVIQRIGFSRPVFTVRRDEGPYSTSNELEWLLALHTARATYGPALLLQSPLHANPALALHTLQLPQDSGWAVHRMTAEVVHPYAVKRDIEALDAHLLALLRQPRTGLELYHAVRGEEVMESLTPESFAARLGQLAGAGFLFIEGLEPPAAQAG